MTILYFIMLSFLSGVLGRMGGAGKSGQWYDKLLNTKWRDVGCSIIAIVALWLLFGVQRSAWWVYLIIFGLHWGAFSTYWDWMYKNWDNFWFSGFMVGVSMFPAMILFPWLWWVFVVRAVILAMLWGCFNKFLPEKVWLWRRDVAEEFLRYAVSF